MATDRVYDEVDVVGVVVGVVVDVVVVDVVVDVPCAATKAAQLTPISVPSEAAFLYGLPAARL